MRSRVAEGRCVMAGHCPGCGTYHEEDDDRLCGKCKSEGRCESELTKMSVTELCEEWQFARHHAWQHAGLGADGMATEFESRRDAAIAELTRRIGEADELRTEVDDLKRVLQNTRADAQYRIGVMRAELERLTAERDGWKAEAMLYPHTLDGVRIVPKMKVWRTEDHEDIDGEPFEGWTVGEVSLGRAGRWSVLLEGFGRVVNPLLYSSLQACRTANDARQQGGGE